MFMQIKHQQKLLKFSTYPYGRRKLSMQAQAESTNNNQNLRNLA